MLFHRYLPLFFLIFLVSGVSADFLGIGAAFNAVKDGVIYVKGKIDEGVETVREGFRQVNSVVKAPEDWHCGPSNTPFLKDIAYFTTHTCPSDLQSEMNDICKEHDKCYDDREGRRYCDQVFCTDLNIALAESDGSCLAPTLFCKAVKKGGGIAYEGDDSDDDDSDDDDEEDENEEKRKKEQRGSKLGGKRWGLGKKRKRPKGHSTKITKLDFTGYELYSQ